MSRHVESWLTVDSRCQVLSCATAEEGAFFHCGCCNRVLGKAAEVVKSEVDAEPRESARKRVPTIIGARERPTTDAVRGFANNSIRLRLHLSLCLHRELYT